MKTVILGFLFAFLLAPAAFGGDAIAIGYAEDGAWAALTYNRSSTPRGGSHYHDAAQACTFALRDLQTRASDYYFARTEILGRSDKTGYVAVARGKAINRSTDVTAVGRGKSQLEADNNAMKKLFDREATTDSEIVYRYFSYGSDFGKNANHKTSRSAKKAVHGNIRKA
jgi:hypothetical protein